ncbi:helix-turn-helix domain-containing protein [Streptomyces sp. NPDC085481]|uniref:AraC-like ligand-binding domain-containing protein n=1 Tax=Streptomyces sp. NPDC085481 TaxID=3365727 RepID=UPI0037CF7FC5
MDVHHFATEALPPRERFDHWHDLTAGALLATTMHSEHADDFRAEARAVDLGAVQVTAMRYPSMTVARTPRLIARSDPGYYQLSLTVSGAMWLDHNGRETALGAGDMLVFDSSRPFQGGTRGDGTEPDGRLDHIIAHFPKALLPLPARDADRLLALRLPGDTGFGALLARFLVQVVTDAAAYRPADAPRLETVLLDLLAGAAAQRLDADAAAAPDSRRRALLLSVQDFVRRRLADPDLSPSVIAAAHHVSVRYLHRLHEERGVTVAALIRSLRLDKARQDLADPAQRRTPVHDIASRWGFRHQAAFSRAFRAAYGCSPSEYRECTQSQ